MLRAGLTTAGLVSSCTSPKRRTSSSRSDLSTDRDRVGPNGVMSCVGHHPLATDCGIGPADHAPTRRQQAMLLWQLSQAADHKSEPRSAVSVGPVADARPLWP